jgi:hypothetical protein
MDLCFTQCFLDGSPHAVCVKLTFNHVFVYVTNVIVSLVVGIHGYNPFSTLPINCFLFQGCQYGVHNS